MTKKKMDSLAKYLHSAKGGKELLKALKEADKINKRLSELRKVDLKTLYEPVTI